MYRHALLAAAVLFVLSCDWDDGPGDDGCNRQVIDIYTCENPDKDHLNARGEPDPCHEDDDPCPGQCVPIPPAGWDSFPMLLWIGTELAPDCPEDRAGTAVFDGYIDMVEPPECAPCACEPPSGACTLPGILTAHEAAFCGAGVTTDFLPDMWVEDFCHQLLTPVDAMSVTMGPLTMTETGCKPSGPPPPRDGAAPGKTIVRACRGVAYPPCLDPDLLCVPTAEPPPPGFSQCIFRPDEHECPATYPVKHVVFEGVNDQRTCSACACADPEGSMCTSMVSLLGQGCMQLIDTSAITQEGEQCVGLAPGVVTTIEGVYAAAPAYEAGSCEPTGGQLEGEAKPIGLSTFCCLMTE